MSDTTGYPDGESTFMDRLTDSCAPIPDFFEKMGAPDARGFSAGEHTFAATTMDASVDPDGTVRTGRKAGPSNMARGA